MRQLQRLETPDTHYMTPRWFLFFCSVILPGTIQLSMLSGLPSGKQSLWAAAVMVQGTYGPLPSRYGPLQLWSSTHMGHILNGLGVHIEAVIGFKVGI